MMRCATTSRTSQSAQALGVVQACSGNVARYCFSLSDSVWTTVTHSCCEDMVPPSQRFLPCQRATCPFLHQGLGPDVPLRGLTPRVRRGRHRERGTGGPCLP